MYKILLQIFLIIIFFSSSCKNSNNCLENTGVALDSIFFRTNIFKIINVYDIFDVYLKQDSICSLKIVANSSLLKNVSFCIKDSVLEIDDRNKCYFIKGYDNKIKLYISSPNVEEVNFYSASSFFSIDTLKFKRFLFRAYGYLAFADFTAQCSDHLFISLWNVAGDYKIHGRTKYLQILNDGTSYIHAFDLVSQYCYIKQSSSGNVEITVLDKLTARLLSAGNILYKGNPQFDTIVRGRGKILKMTK